MILEIDKRLKEDLKKIKVLRAYELAATNLTFSSSSEGLEKIIDPARLRELKTLGAYELAVSKMARLPDSPKRRYKRPDISSYVKKS